MKYLYTILFFLVCYESQAQYQEFQLELVDANVGSAIWEGCSGCSGCSDESNDAGLNTIFQNHNVTYYQDAYVFSSEIEEMWLKTYLVACDSCDGNQFLQDLNNYSSVIRLANNHPEN
ncbi:hypothetical protein [Psychroserpens sp.]